MKFCQNKFILIFNEFHKLWQVRAIARMSNEPNNNAEFINQNCGKGFVECIISYWNYFFKPYWIKSISYLSLFCESVSTLKLFLNSLRKSEIDNICDEKSLKHSLFQLVFQPLLNFQRLKRLKFQSQITHKDMA